MIFGRFAGTSGRTILVGHAIAVELTRNDEDHPRKSEQELEEERREQEKKEKEEEQKEKEDQRGE